MKILLIVHRYGEDIVGGAELHARWLAEHLKEKGYDIEVATTCAKDYVTWKNEYPQGDTTINGVPLHRFKVDKERNFKTYPDIETRAFYNPDNLVYGEEWEKAQGPYTSDLLKFLEKHKNTYDRFIYMPYLYATTYYGIQLTPKEKNILLPLAHNELPFFTKVVEKVFTNASYFVYNTKEEEALLHKRMPFMRSMPGTIVGIGINEPDNIEDLIQNKHSDTPYIIYSGRIDEAKGCPELFSFFLRYKKEHDTSLQLFLTGKDIIKIPQSDDIHYFGFVSEEKKFALMAKAIALVVPSKKESLSMILLESLLCQTPVLVNAHCDVLVAHAIQGNCGLWYKNYQEFATCLDYLQNTQKIPAIMGKNGRAYVHAHYNWNVILQKYDQILQK